MHPHNTEISDFWPQMVRPLPLVRPCGLWHSVLAAPANWYNCGGFLDSGHGDSSSPLGNAPGSTCCSADTKHLFWIEGIAGVPFLMQDQGWPLPVYSTHCRTRRVHRLPLSLLQDHSLNPHFTASFLTGHPNYSSFYNITHKCHPDKNVSLNNTYGSCIDLFLDSKCKSLSRRGVPSLPFNSGVEFCLYHPLSLSAFHSLIMLWLLWGPLNTRFFFFFFLFFFPSHVKQ